MGGLTPGIADQNKLQQQQEQEEDEDDDEDEDDEKIMSAEEGDGFAGAIYSGSRFRGASQVEKEEENVPDDEKYEQMEAPPAAYSDYGSDMEEEEHFGDLEPEPQSRQESVHSKHLSVAIEAGKVKNAAAKLAIDPTAMLPGASAPKIPKPNASEMAMDEDASAAALSRPAAPGK